MEQIRKEGYNITEPQCLNPELAGQRRRDCFCLFHRDYGQDTEYCQQLKEEIEKLIRRGNLKRFIYKEHDGREAPEKRRNEETLREEPTDTAKGPARVIRAISDRRLKCGGCIHCPSNPRLNGMNQTITFEKASELPPALVDTNPFIITASIGNIEIEDLLVDGGSACNVLPLNTFRKMGINEEHLEKVHGVIRGVTGHDTPILGKITLPVVFGT